MAQAKKTNKRRQAKGNRATQESAPVLDAAAVAEFMVCGRTTTEIAKAFDLTQRAAKKMLKAGLADHCIFCGPETPAGEATYVAVPTSSGRKVADRIWTFQRSPDQPYGVVSFPNAKGFTKIRIVPIDGIYFGDPEHEAERFAADVAQIRREPNTFCFLNGDAISQVTGGKPKERQARSLELTAEFIEMMRPIAHKILWAQRGCFEDKQLKQQRIDPLEHTCTELGIPYFTEPVYIDFIWRGHLWSLWAMHGKSAAKMKGSRMNSLRGPAKMHDFTHFIIRGHIGDAMWNKVTKVVRRPSAGRLEQLEEYHIILSNYRRYLGTAAARQGETPPSNDAIVLYLYPEGNHRAKTTQARGVKP